MKVGWGFTAARRQASRLAGLVLLPAGWPIQVAVGRQALRLALKANVIWKTYLPFSLQKQPGNEATSQPALFDLRPTQAAAEQSGDRQRREKALPFLKEEKSEHERARTCELTRQQFCARHCELPLSKMGNQGLFPGVAVPLAFFCTLFFRHRKKSVNAP